MKRLIQITAGRGPEECCYVVAQTLKLMMKECKSLDCYCEVVQREKSDLSGNLRSATLLVETKNAPEILLDWLGTVQWIGQSPFRLQHKRKNWFIGVFEVATDILTNFSLDDVSFQTFRSSGPGGQHVNKVNSAVRAIHTPSGIAVTVQDTRSQIQNKRLASERLHHKWQEVQLERWSDSQQDAWTNHLDLQRGNPVKILRAKDFKMKAETKKFRDQRSTEKQQWKKDLTA